MKGAEGQRCCRTCDSTTVFRRFYPLRANRRAPRACNPGHVRLCQTKTSQQPANRALTSTKTDVEVDVRNRTQSVLIRASSLHKWRPGHDPTKWGPCDAPHSNQRSLRGSFLFTMYKILHASRHEGRYPPKADIQKQNSSFALNDQRPVLASLSSWLSAPGNGGAAKFHDGIELV